MSFDFITDDSKRVIYNSLPQIYSSFHHSDGEAVYDSAYLVEYWEQVFSQWQNALDVLLSFNGDYDIFTVEQLDSFAPFFGFAGDFYNSEWTKETKIKMFKGVYQDPFIWRFRGSRAVFEYVTESLGVEAYLTTDRGCIAGIAIAGDICGDGSNIGEIVVKYPAEYADNSIEKGAIEYLVSYFIPANIHVTLRPFQVN